MKKFSEAKKLQQLLENLREENCAPEVPKVQKSNPESKPSPLPSPKPDEQEQTSPRASVNPSAAERGQRDLYFFCNEILGYKDMLPRVHQQACDLFGPPPDLSKPFEQQDEIHNYLYLDPRGEFKTSISLGKTIQNVINFPDVAILRMSGVENLVKRTIQEMRDQYLTNSTFRSLYPDHVPYSSKRGEDGMAPTEWGTAYGATSPARKRPRREPSISISTLESVKAGSHYEWITGDDVVHEKNYQTRELLQKTIDDWDLSRNLLNPQGYRELDGTRYDWSDLYGRVIEQNQKVGAWRILCRPIWTDDLEFAKRNGFVIPEDYQPGDLLHLHPERWTLRELAEIQEDNQYLFNCQRLNNPVPQSADNFPMLELIKHTVTRDKYPDTGLLNLFMASWFDLADPEAEPAVIVVGGWDARSRLFLVDLSVGRFKPSQLIEQLIQFWYKWPISRVVFEDKRRQRLLEAGLNAKLREVRLSMPIDWVKFGGSQQTEDDLINQVLALEPLLRSKQLWFHKELPHLTNLYLQFSRFPKFKLRAIPFAISRLMHYRKNAATVGNQAVYGSELYSPSISWDTVDPELGAGLVG